MAHIVVLGAGLGGSIMAYELADQIGPNDHITVITKDPIYHFVPSNPWVAVGWRKRDEVSIDLAPVMEKKVSAFARWRRNVCTLPKTGSLWSMKHPSSMIIW